MGSQVFNSSNQELPFSFSLKPTAGCPQNPKSQTRWIEEDEAEMNFGEEGKVKQGALDGHEKAENGVVGEEETTRVWVEEGNKECGW